MPARVELVGASGRLRWNGHLRVPLGSDGVVCARIGAHLPPAEAWALVCGLAETLEGAQSVADVLARVEPRDDLALLACDGADWVTLGVAEVRGVGAPVEGVPAAVDGDLIALGNGDARPGDWT